MIEFNPKDATSALFYFHSRCSCGDEIRPFLGDLQRALPHTAIWAGDGPTDGQACDPVMRAEVTYGTSRQRYWFVFPMQSTTGEAFVKSSEAMGAVLATCGGYVNQLVDRTIARLAIDPARVLLCGHQHGACVALAAAMLRRDDPYRTVVLFDPWPWEMLYLEHERDLPDTRVICVDNRWTRSRDASRGVPGPVFEGYRHHGVAAEGVLLEDGRDQPDAHMFAEAARQMQALLA